MLTPLSERDDKIQKVKKVIENREKLLREIYKGIRDSTEENKYLKGVVEDYTHYYANMKKQKESQLDALHKLMNYIDTILHNNSSVSSRRSKAHEDKKDIMREIKKIKREIENL